MYIIISPFINPVCKQATMKVISGNDPFCIVITRVPQLTSSTIAESNISKQCSKSRFADSTSLTITRDSEAIEISKYLEHNSFFPLNATQFKDVKGCVINWLWHNNRRFENNSGSWSQSEKNLHSNVLEVMTASAAIKDDKISNGCLLFEIEKTTRFVINKWRSPSKHINLMFLQLFRNCVESAQKSISNTNYCIIIKLGRSHSSRNVPGSNISLEQRKGQDDITKKHENKEIHRITSPSRLCDLLPEFRTFKGKGLIIIQRQSNGP